MGTTEGAEVGGGHVTVEQPCDRMARCLPAGPLRPHHWCQRRRSRPRRPSQLRLRVIGSQQPGRSL
jgi:hypothetical protein